MLTLNLDPKKDKITRRESIFPPASQEEGANLPEKPRRRGQARKNLCPAAQEMVEIRNKLGMSQPDFAVALGESRDKIINIENGRLKHVPVDLLQNARELLESEQDTRVRPLAELEGLSMAQLMERWWEMMGTKDDKEAAILLGTTMTTIDRWRNTDTRPSSGDLLRYELIAQRVKERRRTG